MRWTVRKEIQRDKEVLVIKRSFENKVERLPVKQYAQIRDDVEKMTEFVKRLNAPIDARVRVNFQHAFINDALLDEYLEDLKTIIPTASVAQTEFGYVKNYFLHFFITKQGIIDPSKWINLEVKWGAYLGSESPDGPKGSRLKGVKAETTKRKVVNAANRFMAWLHKRRSNEVPKVQFAPISKAKYRAIKAQRELDGDTEDHVYIPKKDLALILEKLPDSLEPYVYLMLRYGLRIAEAAGVKTGDVKKQHFFTQRQMVKLGKYKPLKGRKMRKVPHWFCKPADAYRWVTQAEERIQHQRTLSKLWREYVDLLGMAYTFHDLRHTWTTDAMRQFGKEEPRDVQLAAGHVNLATTMRYLHDDRDLGDDEFVPDDAA